MHKLQRGLDEVDRKVEALKKNFEKTTTEAAKLRVELEKAEETIKAAELLVGKLDVEYDRWNSQVRRDYDRNILRSCLTGEFSVGR